MSKRPDIDWFYNKVEARRRTFDELVNQRNDDFEKKLSTQRFGKSFIPFESLKLVKSYMESQKNQEQNAKDNEEVDLTDDDILNYVQGGKVIQNLSQEEFEAMYDVREQE